MRPFRFAAAAAIIALSACDQSPKEPKVEVENAWVQLPAVPARPGSAYFTLTSNNDPTKLVNVASSRVGRVELHGTVTENGISKMRPLINPVFPADGEFVFGPGGNHAMLFDIDPALKPGDKIDLTFTFDPAPPVTIQADVRAMGGGHEGH